jgi:hypothetical protein
MRELQLDQAINKYRLEKMSESLDKKLTPKQRGEKTTVRMLVSSWEKLYLWQNCGRVWLISKYQDFIVSHKFRCLWIKYISKRKGDREKEGEGCFIIWLYCHLLLHARNWSLDT